VGIEAEVRQRADAADPLLVEFVVMAKSKQPPSPSDTLEELLDRVSNTREELTAIERSLERLRADIAESQKTRKKHYLLATLS
jgi:hypothetical protein